MHTPIAGILAIGSELTSGQIINRNASWLSQRLLSLGIETKTHLCVPDDREQIRSSLQVLESQVQLLFVTGGLGPTSDDFTRECVAAWAELPLQWSEETWNWIQARLSERNVKIREFQKQQCYFPKGAQILHNSRGTAHGFQFQKGNALQVFVLPGPPREIECIWQESVQPWLQKNFPVLDRKITKSWDCFGVGESDVAHRAETALQACPFEKGYRVHLPYVEFKLSYRSSEADQAKPYLQAVETALQPWVVARDGQDPADLWLDRLKFYDQILIWDQVTEGFLMERLVPGLRAKGLHSKVFFAPERPSPRKSLRHLTLGLHSSRDNMAKLEWSLGTQNQSYLAESPYRGQLMQEREKQYFAEKAILFWASLNSLC